MYPVYSFLTSQGVKLHKISKHLFCSWIINKCFYGYRFVLWIPLVESNMDNMSMSILLRTYYHRNKIYYIIYHLLYYYILLYIFGTHSMIYISQMGRTRSYGNDNISSTFHSLPVQCLPTCSVEFYPSFIRYLNPLKNLGDNDNLFQLII